MLFCSVSRTWRFIAPHSSIHNAVKQSRFLPTTTKEKKPKPSASFWQVNGPSVSHSQSKETGRRSFRGQFKIVAKTFVIQSSGQKTLIHVSNVNDLLRFFFGEFATEPLNGRDNELAKPKWVSQTLSRTLMRMIRQSDDRDGCGGTDGNPSKSQSQCH